MADPGPTTASVRVLDAASTAVVLGSTQPADVVDAAAAADMGWEVARRRSGGAAVVVGPGQVLWVDVVLPTADPRSDPDITGAGRWLGALWADSLHDAGIHGARAWGGGMVRTEWSPLVCFAGLGPGEVVVDGRKVVGFSQRRTRAGALFQCAVLLRWAPAELLHVLRLDRSRRDRAATALADIAGPVAAEVAIRAAEGLTRRLVPDAPGGVSGDEPGGGQAATRPEVPSSPPPAGRPG